MEGIFLFYKPVGWTNKAIVGFLKRTLNTPKLGHAGTLDPFAEGLMVVAIGRKFTRTLHDILIGGTKEYIATIELGRVSDTFDSTGVITTIKSDKQPTHEHIGHVITTHLLGERLQIPPIYSAKKFSGKRLRDIAKRYGAHELAASRAKTVILHDFTILSYSYPLLTVRLTVSSGYYIRTFGNDLGTLLATGAFLAGLQRTRINHYVVQDAISPDTLSERIEAQGTLFGSVQGVGYRLLITELAHRYDCTGYVRNNPDGSVSFLVQGAQRDVSSFLKFVLPGPYASRVNDHIFLIKKPSALFPAFSVTQ